MRNPTFKSFLSGHCNAQQVYDFVRDRLLEQQCTSSTKNDGCAYRGLNGAKCAIGWLIPDNKYDERMEGDVDSLYEFYNISYMRINNDKNVDKYEFLSRLQMAHDSAPNSAKTGAAFIKYITPKLRTVALKYGLKP